MLSRELKELDGRRPVKEWRDLAQSGEGNEL